MTDLAPTPRPESGYLPDKTQILGTPISMTSYDEVIEIIDHRPADRPTAIAVCNVHSVMSARRDPALRAAITEAQIATTDGVPLVWLLRLTCQPRQTRVYGPDLMDLALRAGVERGWTHYLYGTTPETLERLQQAIQRFAPGAKIVGTTAPAYRPLTADERGAAIASFVDSRADIIWVGLGMPRQELFMHEVAARLPGQAIVGVGAAFDLLSGTVPQAPDRLQRLGLEWAFRLAQEPRRLWRRYLLNNPLYVALALAQVLRYRLQCS